MKPASETDVKLFEERLGCTLPPDYRNFLMTCNGGSIDPSQYSPVVNADVAGKLIDNNEQFQTEEIAVEYFYTLDKETIETNLHLRSFTYLHDGLERYNELTHIDDSFSPPHGKMIAFAACSPSGVFLVCEGEYAGNVILYDPEVRADSSIDYFGFLANSFNEFMLSLYYDSTAE